MEEVRHPYVTRTIRTLYTLYRNASRLIFYGLNMINLLAQNDYRLPPMTTIEEIALEDERRQRKRDWEELEEADQERLRKLAEEAEQMRRERR